MLGEFCECGPIFVLAENDNEAIFNAILDRKPMLSKKASAFYKGRENFVLEIKRNRFLYESKIIPRLDFGRGAKGKNASTTWEEK